jgi:hypothetical protein
MTALRLKKPSPAMLIACLALAVASAGTAQAVVGSDVRVVGITKARGKVAPIKSGGVNASYAKCKNGTAIGGGFDVLGGPGYVYVTHADIDFGGAEFLVQGIVPVGAPGSSIVAYAYCAPEGKVFVP